MGKTNLNLQQTQEMLRHVSKGLVDNKDLLTQADKAVGDGDHGVGMARGFEAVSRALEGQAFGALDELLKTVGMSLMTSVGGASGAIFGTFFRGGAKNLKGRHNFDAGALSLMLLDGLNAVIARGGARPGDKTMVDALAPAASVSRELTFAPLDESLTAVAEAARQGMENTKGMVASVGKAKTLGQRAIGHPDPGAISMYLILNFMTEYVREREALS